MTRHTVLALFLIASVIGSAFGQTFTIAERLTLLQNDYNGFPQTFESFDTGVIPPSKIFESIQQAHTQIANLPADPGNFLNNAANKAQLTKVVKSDQKMLREAMEYVHRNYLKANLSEFFRPVFQNFLATMYRMISRLTSPFEQKLNTWTPILIGDALRGILVDLRQIMLERLEEVTPEMCQLKKSNKLDLDSSLMVDEILQSLRDAAGKVNLVTCNGIAGCLFRLMPIAGRIALKANCP